MIKQNYKAWDINYKDFPENNSIEEQLKFLIGFAVLAPSSHNSQPWKFEVCENKVSLSANMDRSLAVGDAKNRFLYLSLGCALENLLIAAEYFGFEYKIIY